MLDKIFLKIVEYRLNSNYKIIKQATLDISPLALAVIPWGILSGTIAINIGLSLFQAQAMSLFIFAGAAQLSAMTLLSGGASTLSISGSVFAISSRHLLYSIDLRKEVYKLPLKWKIPLAFFLTDEMYAVTKAHMLKTGKFSKLYSLWAGIMFYIVWNISTYIGIVMGEKFDNLDKLGLDFAIVAVFVAITAEHLKSIPMLVTTVVSGIASVYFKSLYPDTYVIISALIGMLCGYLVSKVVK